MRGFASGPHYKSSLELVVMVSIYWCLCSLLKWLSLLTVSSFFAFHWSTITKAVWPFLGLASVNSYFSWLLTRPWNAHGLWADLGPYSPLSVSLPSWHWAARQYFPSVEWRAWHIKFDMVSETTANQRCTTHFYSTILWEPAGMRSLSARLNTVWHSEPNSTPRNNYVSYSSQKHCGWE